MTHRDLRDHKQIRKGARGFAWRLRDRRRRKDRRLLSESLEQRQLLAGPDLIGVQPNEGSLINGGEVLFVSPREIVFRFDDSTELDPTTLDGIRITRAGEDGVFESATATSDLGTAGAALVEFRAIQSGEIGNGIEVNFLSSSRPGSAIPITVIDNTVTIEVNSNPANPTRVQGLISAVANHPIAKDLLEVIQVSGSAQTPVGTTIVSGLSLTLAGANAAEAATDFGTAGAVSVRIVSQLSGADGLGTQITIERRNFGGPTNPLVVVDGQSILVQLNSSFGSESTAQDFIDAINNNPDSAALVSVLPQGGDLSTKIGAGTAPLPTLSLTGVTDVVIEPGFIGLGDSPREVVFRFAQPLPDDQYQIDILGTGPSALLNTIGEPFGDGVDESRQFSINLGPKVVAVVPEPVRRNAAGQLVPQAGKIEVHFNDDRLNVADATNPAFYQLIFTRDTVSNTDDYIVPLAAGSVQYNSSTGIATLDFGRPLSRILDPLTGQPIEGAARLRVGTTAGLPGAPVEMSIAGDPEDTFADATVISLGSDSLNSVRLASEIVNTQPYGLSLPGPEVPGVRDVRPDDPSRLDRPVPLDHLRADGDSTDGISVKGYSFPSSWLGDDPNRAGIELDETYFNIISEEQKERVREVMTLFSQYLGVSFFEVEGTETTDPNVLSIAVGELYGADAESFSAEGGLPAAVGFNGLSPLVVMDFADFDDSIDDQFGGDFFRGAMFAVGQGLGFGFAEDLPQPITQPPVLGNAPIAQLADEVEPSYPSFGDIVHGQYLYRPESTDIDLFQFELTALGTFTVETLAERLANPSLLDTALRLYREVSPGQYVEVAQNDDYFSNDSLIRFDLTQTGTYIVGVSARGNTSYDPAIDNSGFGGLTEGQYELIATFDPLVTDLMTDTTNVALDGDGDGRPGGVFDFWFEPADPTDTIYVDKEASLGGTGTVSSPFQQIDLAIAEAVRRGSEDITIRLVANGGLDGLVQTPADNFSYQIGSTSIGTALEDGRTLDLPRGVDLVIDAGVILKLSDARIGIGSVSPTVNVSDASLQVLGTPRILTAAGTVARDDMGQIVPGSVYFTSINDSTIGMGNSPAFAPAPGPGDWGGIDFRGDLDAADESRRNRELEGVFLNHIQFADLRYGGGSVSIAGRQTVVSPIDLAITRATVINSRITHSADAAMAATPDTFAETIFTDPLYQSAAPFTPDYSRIGPRIAGNTLIDNSINGLFIRIVTRTGDVLESISTTTRFDDTDITHVLAENLVIDGTPGGAIINTAAPPTLLVNTQAVIGSGEVPAGTYTYRLTNVTRNGLESAASLSTGEVMLGAVGGIRLTNLPAVKLGSDFVARRLYRAEEGSPDDFRLVATLNATDTSYLDSAATGTAKLTADTAVLRSRLDASLIIDPGTVIKLDGARIEARLGAGLIAEGLPSLPVVFTSLEDQRYGSGGTFDTNDRGDAGELNPGDWGGIYIGPAGSASLDYAVIAGGGGTTRIEGGFASFNAIEVHQGNLRLANSRLELNADGRGEPNDERVGRGDNATGGLFVRAAAPVIVNNEFVGNQAVAISVDVNSLSDLEVSDPGRSTGNLGRVSVAGNAGPLLQGNVFDNNRINGMQVRGGQVAVAGVWDDVDVVHVVTDSIEVPNQHIYGGLLLKSDARGSLVVKFESDPGETAGIVVGGNLQSASEEFVDIADRIGGALQVIGHPDFPVVLTTLADDTAGAGFTLNGTAGVDTNNNGIVAAGSTDASLALPTGPEVNNGTLIDNDVNVNRVGHFEADIGNGNGIGILNDGAITLSGVTVRDLATAQTLINQDYIFAYQTYVTTADGILSLEETTITQPATLIANDVVESRGTFDGPNGTVEWIATSSFINGVARLDTRLELDAGDNALGDIRVISYLDEDVEGIDDDILVTTGTPGEADFRAFTIDGVRRFGFSQGGFYAEDGENLVNATYDGWAADQFNELQTQIVADTQTYSIAGDIDLTDLPRSTDIDFGTRYGPADVTTAFSWTTNAAASTAAITSFLELLAADPALQATTPIFDSGLWNGIVIREGASDRNVAAFAEQEPVRTSLVDDNDFVGDGNAIPGQAQFLGEIAPNEKSGDENRRLGFVVHGAIATRDDLDVYAFIAESGTEVWLDIDRTSNQFDSVVELIDANGIVLAASNDSLLAETDPDALFNRPGVIDPGAVRPLSVVQDMSGGPLTDAELQDSYTTNRKDAGMRIVLPGELGTRNLYHVRVRSSNTTDPTHFGGPVRGGLSHGNYQLQIRLRETDESAGTQLRFADVRYATDGLHIIGQPLHSPLTGEEFEITGDNGSIVTAQRLGFFSSATDQLALGAGPLQSDRLAISIAGSLDAGDVDFYQFEVAYPNLQPDGLPRHLSTVIDLDYGFGFGRPDMRLTLFDSAGNVIYFGDDSNVADDLPTTDQFSNIEDLSRGSISTKDPFIGPIELAEGTYYLAVSGVGPSGAGFVPPQFDQFFNVDSDNPLLRLEPVDSVRRIAEDRIGSFGGGTATAPVVPILFDENSIVPFSLDDVLLYVNTGSSLYLVNPFTGENYLAGDPQGNTLGSFGIEQGISEVAFRANGELFAYTNNGPIATDDATQYVRIDASTAAVTNIGGTGITTNSQDPADPPDDGALDVASDTGISVNAITIASFQGNETGYFVGNRVGPTSGLQYSRNILYAFDDETGLIQGPVYDNPNQIDAGAGTSPRELGQIDVNEQASLARLGISAASVRNNQGVIVPGLADGDTFTITAIAGGELTFELEQGFTIVADTAPVRDGDLVVVDGTTFEFNTGTRLQLSDPVPAGALAVGTIVTIEFAGTSRRFEFVGTNAPATGNAPILLLNSNGSTRSAAAVASDLANEVNLRFPGIDADAFNNEVFFAGQPTSITIDGSGVATVGDDLLGDPTAVEVLVNETIAPDTLMQILASLMTAEGITVDRVGTQMALPAAAAVSVDPLNPILTTGVFLDGEPNVLVGNVEIQIAPGDSVDVIRQKFTDAINAAAASGALPGVSVDQAGSTNSSLLIDGGTVTATGNLVGGAAATGGTVVGIELVGNTLYALTDIGGLFTVPASRLSVPGANGNNPNIADPVSTATDLAGLDVTFTALRSGPDSVNGGTLQQMLFGITNTGDIYAFNLAGELQPIFAGGSSSISTGIFGAQGLDFSTLDYNLWHVTSQFDLIQRDLDPGHGINQLDNGTGVVTRASVPGGASLAFKFEPNAFNGNYAPGDVPVLFDGAGNVLNPRQDEQLIASTYNFPGGAKGVVESNPFSLAGYSSADKPVLYFNYYLQTEGDDGRDTLRVHVITPDGVEHLVATSNLNIEPGTRDDEFDDPDRLDDIDADVQQVFDTTRSVNDSWRQVRVPLDDFANKADLRLRIEFSTSGTTRTTSDALRVVSGAVLAGTSDREFTIRSDTPGGGNQRFVLQLATSVAFPSGAELAEFYLDPSALAVIDVEGQAYVLDDGTRILQPGQMSIDLLLGQPFGTTLADLSGADIAAAVARATLPLDGAIQVISGVNFSDAEDIPGQTGRNDLLATATPLPYTGGSARILGDGRLGSLDQGTGLVTNLDDVDLVQLTVSADTLIEFDIEILSAAVADPVVRFFDPDGNDLPTVVDPTTGTIRYIAETDGTVFIGISGAGNDLYDPTDLETVVPGDVDEDSSYTVTLAITALTAAGNVVVYEGATQPISVSPDTLLSLNQPEAPPGTTAIPISQFMSADEIAEAVAAAIATRFGAGQLGSVPVSGSTVRLGGLSVSDPGPFVRESDRYEFADGYRAGLSNNEFEGVYLDDFIIGFVERGEITTGASTVGGDFIEDGRLTFPNPPETTSDVFAGTYQVEIRDASEYVSSAESARFRTFDTNQPLSDAVLITALSATELRDGATFAIDDGRNTVVFEFDLVESSTGVTPGTVRVPYTLQLSDLESGIVRPQTAAEVAASIVAAVTRDDVQELINVSAVVDSGVESTLSPRIILPGEVLVEDRDGVLADVTRVSLRGDDNRERDAQGVILVENSVFFRNAEHGVVVSHGTSADVAGQSTPSVVRYPRNLVELNSEQITSGVVLQSNVMAFNDAGGLQINGIGLGVNDTAGDPVAFDRIVNNTIIGGQVFAGISAPAEEFEGVVFPVGRISFADAVLDYSPDAGGDPPTQIHQMADAALGPPDCMGRGAEPLDSQFSVSLGLGGSLTVQFVDNLLTGSGDSDPDLIVFETGEIESVRVEISRDGVNFFSVGIIGGLSNTVDIDQFGFGPRDQFAIVRLTDLRQGSDDVTSLGADIDSIGAISSTPVERYIAGGTGIELTGNAAPALMNNVVANSELGLQLDPLYTLPILGGNTYYRNTADAPAGASLGEFAQIVPDSEVLFFGAAAQVFVPAAGASIIDSSLDSLLDRASLTTVKAPLGLPPSPIIAPRLDVNGQLRVDDPAVEPPSGLGERIFKDRGASDRGDLVGPRVVLLSPQAPDLGLDAGLVTVSGQAPQAFEVQFIDGLAPADIVPGTGIDDRTVSSDSVLLSKDGQVLVEGRDYRFGYNPSTNVARFTPIAGVWEQDSTYVIRLADSRDGIIQAVAGSAYDDGDVLRVADSFAQVTRFEYETGITLAPTSTALDASTADGVVVEVFDGVTTVGFEFDNDQTFDPTNTIVEIPETGPASLVFEALAIAVNASILNVVATAGDFGVQFLGTEPLTEVTAETTLLAASGSIGTSIGFGIQIPNDGAEIADTVEDEQTFIIRRGAAIEVTFELDSDGFLATEGAIPVNFAFNDSLDDLADELVRAIGGSGLGLGVANVGSGRVFLGGDANYSVDPVDSTLLVVGVPGQGPTVPITIGLEQTADQTAQTIATAIDAADLSGVTTTVFGTKILVEGTAGINGVGAANTVVVSDEVGNQVQSNQADGGTELTIFVGGGEDYGDAPYASTSGTDPARHGVDVTFALAPVGAASTVSAEAAPRLIDADDDNGVRIPSDLEPGLVASLVIDVTNASGEAFQINAWFDWDADGVFESNEQITVSSVQFGPDAQGQLTIPIQVPGDAAVGETYARFRLFRPSENPLLGPSGDAASGEVEDYRILVGNNQFQNPNAIFDNNGNNIGRYDVNNSGFVSALDALQIINAMRRNGGNEINLSDEPLPADLPAYPDVNGDGRVSAADALQVINKLAEIVSEGEAPAGTAEIASPFVPVADGVLASSGTVIGDQLIAQQKQNQRPLVESVTTIDTPPSKTSVFDSAAVVELDPIVDTLAADLVDSRPEETAESVDQVFASF